MRVPGTGTPASCGLVRTIATGDLPWMTGFLGWLRSDANMRTASVIGAAEALKALLDANQPGGRALVASVLQRADEPGELLAYWHSRYGRNEPKPLKRGIADALVRLYTEYALLKYDTGSHGYRFADVIERVHVTGEHQEVKGTWRGDLYEHAIDRRHDRGNAVPGAAHDPGERCAAGSGRRGRARPAVRRPPQGSGNDVGGRPIAGRE